MAEEVCCIVCLGSLTSTFEGVQIGQEPAESDDRLTESAGQKTSENDHELFEYAAEPIAHLLPCGHNLHDGCLRPWVERANSCPLCRQNFNQVELRATLNGPCTSSYAVQDKQQAAEVDPSMVIEEDVFEELPPISSCWICESFNDEECLLLCDGCEASCHTFCAGLDGVPRGSWYCTFCQQDGTAQAGEPVRGRFRTRGQQRRLREHRDGSPSSTAWARVWQQVWDRLNLDLDFPFDEERQVEDHERSEANRREFREWERRFRVAERQGGAARFRDTATALLNLRGSNRPQTPPRAESQEELRAWNAFEKAKQLQASEDTSPSRRNKRKSRTASPEEPRLEQTQERPLKRPRTRRTLEITEPQSDGGQESSNAPRQRESSTSSQSGRRPVNGERSLSGPSFLTSLIQEVQNSPTNTDTAASGTPIINGNLANHLDHSSPASLSPVSSPSTSNHPSPRARSTSPPPYRIRPVSPPPLTSRIEPIFVQQQPEYSPSSPSSRPLSDTEDKDDGVDTSNRRTRQRDKRSPELSDAKRNISPSRASMSFSAKAEIQKMVSAALKPMYKNKEIDTDQYTDINREVSRMLYDMVGEAGGVKDGPEKDKWQSIAAQEVESAVKKVKGRDGQVTA